MSRCLLCNFNSRVFPKQSYTCGNPILPCLPIVVYTEGRYGYLFLHNKGLGAHIYAKSHHRRYKGKTGCKGIQIPTGELTDPFEQVWRIEQKI